MGRQLREVRGILFGGTDTLVHTLVAPDGGHGPVAPVPRAAEALAGVRGAGLPVGVVSATRGGGVQPVGSASEVSRRALMGRLLGPFDTWQSCDHGPRHRCACRAPAPGLVLQGAAEMGVASHSVAVISDMGPDMKAAQAAGAVGILVPSRHTLRAEMAEVPLVAPDLISAVRGVLGMDRSWVPGHSLASERVVTVPLPRLPQVPADPRAGARANGAGVRRES